jgi:YhgE/Pip-like protein
MKLLKNKLAIVSPLLVLTIIFIFSLTLIPSVNMSPKNLPVAFVNEDEGIVVPDQGTVNMGAVMEENMSKMAKAQGSGIPPIKWVKVETLEAVQQGLDNQEYYAALVVPKDFSAKQASMKTPNPTSPEIQILVNQGMNTVASTVVTQVLNGIVDNLNNTVRTQLLEGFQAQGNTVTIAQASILSSPISSTVTNVNEIGTHSANGNAPITLFQPIWMGSIVGAAILFIALSKTSFRNRKEKYAGILTQILMGAILALIAGFGITWLADGMLDLHIPKFADMAWFLTITYFAFFLMITAVLSWLGIRGIPLFVIILFFGAPLLALAPEFMSGFYRDWVYPWLPMRFMVEGLREQFFFGKGFSWSGPTAVLIWIGLVGMAVILLSPLKPSRPVEDEAVTEIK